jgi:hypothetical protein
VCQHWSRIENDIAALAFQKIQGERIGAPLGKLSTGY